MNSSQIFKQEYWKTFQAYAFLEMLWGQQASLIDVNTEKMCPKGNEAEPSGLPIHPDLPKDKYIVITET